MDAEDGADGHTGVEVGGAVNGIACYGVSGALVLGEVDGFFFFFGDENGAFSGGSHGGDENVIADYVEFLLVVAGDIAGASETSEVDEGGTSDVVGYRFEGELEGMAQESGESCVSGGGGSDCFGGGVGGAGEGRLNKTHVKSPVASLCFVCSSVRNLVRVTMSVLISASCAVTPLVAIVRKVYWEEKCGCGGAEVDVGERDGEREMQREMEEGNKEELRRIPIKICICTSSTITSGRCGVAAGRELCTVIEAD